MPISLERAIEEIGAKLHRIEGSVEVIGFTAVSQGRRIDALESINKQGVENKIRCWNRIENVETELSDMRHHKEVVIEIINRQGEEAKRDREEFRDALQELGRKLTEQGERLTEQGERHAEAMDKLVSTNVDILTFAKQQQVSTQKSLDTLAKQVSVPGKVYKATVVLGATIVFLVSVFLTTVALPTFHRHFDSAVEAAKSAFKWW